MHQILKAIVTLAVNTPECRDLARFFNLKSEIINHAAATLGGCLCSLLHVMLGKHTQREQHGSSSAPSWCCCSPGAG